MVAEETKKDVKEKKRAKAPRATSVDEKEGVEEGLYPLPLGAGADEPPDRGSPVAAAAGGAEGDWEPSMEWLMGSLGPFFNNNQGIGELLLDKLKESGVNTEGVALAGLVNVLQQFSKEYKALSEAVGDNLDRINELSAENQDLSDKLQEIVRELGMTKEDGGQPPDIGGDIGGDLGGGMSPDMGAPGGDMGGGMSPDMGAPGGDMGGGMPPDMGAPPPDMGVPGMPPGDVMSDERMKQKVLSDRRMKRLARSMVRQYGERHKNSMTPSSGIINACKEGF